MRLVHRAGRRVLRRWPAGLLLAECVLGAEAPARFTVAAEDVRLAMEARHWPLAGVQVSLAAPVTATVAAPTLEVRSVSPRPGHEAMLQMACVVRAECLPFFATATWPAESPMPDLREAAGTSTGSVSGSSAAGSEAAVVRAGSVATLLLEGDRVHIRLRVVFAQSGRVGETVRVTTPDRKQVYVAEVLTPELLKGEIKR